MSVLSARALAVAALGLGACAEVPFGEGPPPSAECPQQGLGAGSSSQQLELGRLDGDTFVPLVGGETFELFLSPSPWGWSIFAAVRYPLVSGGAGRECALASVGLGTSGSYGLPAHPMRWIDEGGGTGRYVSAEPFRIFVGDDLDALLAGQGEPIQLTVAVNYSSGVFVSNTPPVALTYVNAEGYLSGP